MEHMWHEEGGKDLEEQNGSKGKNRTGKKPAPSNHWYKVIKDFHSMDSRIKQSKIVSH
jgi:hypothetical protein